MLRESVSSSSSDEEYLDLEEEEEEEDTPQTFLCLFCDTTLQSFSQLCDHVLKCHNIDLISVLGPLSFYDVIKTINHTRLHNSSTCEFLKTIGSSANLCDDLLKPVLPDDALLMIDFEELYEKPTSNGSTNNDHQSNENQVKLLESKLAQLQSVYLDLLQSRKPPSAEPQRDAYFDSYADYSIHSEILQDKVRTEAYRDFIYRNPALFANKAVLDVGCGTGILSMFCAKGGASSVVAVDNSEIVEKARLIIKRNCLEDRILVVQGKIEEVALEEKFDVLVSEWMGYALLFECMLDSVILARDKYLKPGGVVAPNRASMFLSGLSDVKSYEKRFGQWKNVYDFDMSDVVPDLYKEAVVESVQSKHIISTACGFKHFDLSVVKVTDLEFSSAFALQFNKQEEQQLTTLVVYFTCFFDGEEFNAVLDTSPQATTTHWVQTLLYLREPVSVTSQHILEGVIRFKKSGVKRGYVISVKGKVFNEIKDVTAEINQEYFLH